VTLGILWATTDFHVKMETDTIIANWVEVDRMQNTSLAKFRELQTK
jgi:hypothetical protein